MFLFGFSWENWNTGDLELALSTRVLFQQLDFLRSLWVSVKSIEGSKSFSDLRPYSVLNLKCVLLSESGYEDHWIVSLESMLKVGLDLNDIWPDLKLPFVSYWEFPLKHVKAGLDLDDIWPELRLPFGFFISPILNVPFHHLSKNIL